MALRLQIVASPSPLNKCSPSPLPTPILAMVVSRPQNHRLPTARMKANSSRIDSTGRKTSSIRCYSALTPELKTTLDKVVTSHKGLKEYSSWPTFPQLYIDGDFFGGCDIAVVGETTNIDSETDYVE
ncbi:Monothiol glutaredoxin-S7, chloroplastic [Sesamum alatum]|uniref:Monothiol glutaredoxin-S7, chloroplastic n=1 Tax=Sesamum alatum TaxID=300844 RepID=A0AAE1XZ39_9LAMI|nr:Monothiol glutaredoxin-S7, chloroplastic [Sesamum alatum]